jgi:tRNA (adenine57-N1/adenine58-N1)-methyltransferase catalytic subunit
MKGFIHILRVTADLYTRALLHKTQILYTPDISVILSQLEIRPGQIIFESGLIWSLTNE